MKKLFFIAILIIATAGINQICGQASLDQIKLMPKNGIKLDAFSIFQKEVAFEYERFLTKNTSLNFRLGFKKYNQEHDFEIGNKINSYMEVKQRNTDFILYIIPYYISPQTKSYEEGRPLERYQYNYYPTFTIPFQTYYRMYLNQNKKWRLYGQFGAMGSISEVYKIEHTINAVEKPKEYITSSESLWAALWGTYSLQSITATDYTEQRNISKEFIMNAGISGAFGMNVLAVNNFTIDLQSELGVNANHFNVENEDINFRSIYGRIKVLIGGTW